MNGRQRRVVELRAQGFTQEAAADLMGISVRTLQRDEADPLVAAEIARLQESGEPFRPEIVALRRALIATKKDGTPDHLVRVQSARALIAAAPPVSVPPAPKANDQSVVHIHVTRQADGDLEIRELPPNDEEATEPPPLTTAEIGGYA